MPTDDEDLRLIGPDAAVMDETLRLYPPVPIDLKQALHDDTLPCGAHVPAGAMVMWSAYLMGRNEQLWGADVAQFRPERWCDARASVRGRMSRARAGSTPRTRSRPARRFRFRPARAFVSA